MPSHTSGAPSVTPTATHIGDLGTQRHGITQCPPGCRPPCGLREKKPEREGVGMEGEDGDKGQWQQSSGAPGTAARQRSAVSGRPGRGPASALSFPLSVPSEKATSLAAPGRLEARAPNARLLGGDRSEPPGFGGIRAPRKGPATGERHLPGLRVPAAEGTPDCNPLSPKQHQTAGQCHPSDAVHRRNQRRRHVGSLAPKETKAGDVAAVPGTALGL
jgi:hypothetical protein